MAAPTVPKDPGISQDMVATLRAIAAFQRGAEVPGAVVVTPTAERGRYSGEANPAARRTPDAPTSE